MTIVNVHEAKTQLSKLLAAVTEGETVIIAKAGKPVAQLVPYEPAARPARLGFLKQADWVVPDNIDAIFEGQIEELFLGDEPNSHADARPTEGDDPRP